LLLFLSAKTQRRMTLTYFDVSIGGEQKGRIVFELFDEKAPLAAGRFKELCQSKEYAKTYFHRVIKTFIIQGGDVNVKDSEGNKYPDLDDLGKDLNNRDYLKDENLADMDKRFLLCMANFSQKDHNSTQFFITLELTPHLNGKHTIFGRVRHGKSILREIERVNVISNKNGEKNAWLPSTKVVVEDSGIWNEADTIPNLIACADQIGGDIYEEYPDDNDIEELDLENSEQCYKICTIIKESATLLFKEKRLRDAFLKYKKAVRYCSELIPDEESNKDLFKKFQELKKTLYLNLSLVSMNMGNYSVCIDYCGFLLQMDDVELTDVQAAKIFYRLGKSYSLLKKYDIALETLQKGALVSPNDPSIQRELAHVSKIVTDAKNEERAKYSKFFA
jgi:peptidyl-prolyl isomerase D